jgi:hypothetical protein
MRHPLKRLHSCYSFFYGLRQRGEFGRSFPPENLDSYELFVDYILLNNDPHWQPQVLVAPLVTEWKRFEDLDKHWPWGKLAKRNSSVPQGTSAYKDVHLRDYYKDDLRIWRSL